MPECGFAGHVSCLVFSELLGFVFWYLTLFGGKSSVIVASNCLILFVSFFSFWYSHYMYVRPFIVVPQSLNIQFYFFRLFSLCFSILKVSIAWTQAQSILFSAISVLHRGPLKIFIIPVILFLISSIYFWFLEFSSLFVLSICSCMLSPFSILSLIISTYLPYLILVLMLARSLQSIIFPL